MIPRRRSEPRSVALVGGEHTVLVVDDEELNRHLYGSVLTSAGYRVALASDGEEALERMVDSGPDVVLLDYRMPKLDGPGVLRWIRSSDEHRETPVVLLTASGDAEHVTAAFDAGADDYLLKPVNPRILLARVRASILARETSRRIKESTRRERDEYALRQRMLSDLEDARAVQLAQLPAFPIVRAPSWASGFVASCGHVGGDVIDVIHLDESTTVSFVIDVVGHGTGAGIVASSVRTELRFLLAAHPIEEALGKLGERLLADAAEKYVCVAVVALRGADFTIVNAGLPPVWIGGPSEARVLVASSGLPPGLMPSIGYTATRGTLRTGEVIAVVSDGLTEPFGPADDVGRTIPRLVQGLDLSEPPTPAALSSAIERLFRVSGVEERPDDATVLIVGMTR